MFDNVAFEVVIGLVFVYLLYSLLITILGELAATWMGLRARILRTAIERMLNDGYYKEIAKQKWAVTDAAFKAWYWLLNKIRQFFLYENSAFKSSFAGRFYNNPSIKYLTRLEADQKLTFETTKPSYITSENFAATLINFLSSKGNGITKLEQLRFCLRYNTLHIQPETVKHIQTILNDAGNDINLFNERLMQWYDETMDRATGWYKRKIRLILFWMGFLLALAFNVDSIQIAKILANDKEARNQLVSMGVELSKDSAKYTQFVNKNGDTVHAKEILDSGYSHVTRDISEANLVLGLGWDFSALHKNGEIEIDGDKEKDLYAKANSLQAYNPLRNEKRDAEKNRQNNSLLKASLQHDTTALQNQLLFDSASILTKADPAVAEDMMRVKHVLKIKDDSLQLLKISLYRDSAMTAGIKGILQQADRPVLMATGNKLFRIDSMTKANNVMTIHGKRYYTASEKISFVIGNIFSKSSRLLGLLLTAFALSLGAPFWFGILNKLVSLRAAGVRPDDGKDDDANTKLSDHPVQSFPTANALIPDIIKADLAEIALGAFTLRVKDETGIIAIGLAPDKINLSSFISVMVESEAVKNYLQKKYGDKEETMGEILITNAFSIPVNYSVQSKNVIHAKAASQMPLTETAGARIANKTGVLGSGTLGCFLKKKGTDKKYILSCWHVMKDNADWNKAIIEHDITNTKTAIATVENGCLADTIDVGIAICNDEVNGMNSNGDFSITAQHREVRPFDALASTEVQLFGKESGYKTATIFHHKMNVQIQYPDGMMYLLRDVFSITNNLASPTIEGDSGAVVTDMSGVPLGMVIGGNETFSYAVKFTNMFSENKLYSEYSFRI